MHIRRSSFAPALLLAAGAALLLLPGCSSTSHRDPMAAGKFSLTFQGDASFNKPHGGQTIHIALVEADTGKVVAKQEGTVSKTDNPAFSFTFGNVLKADTHYDVDYWIDSNFGGGSPGVCDDKSHDHQWKIDLGAVTGDMTHMETHQPAKMTPVCNVFAKM